MRRDNEISYSKFKYNTARNGSAIYNNGDDLILNDDTLISFYPSVIKNKYLELEANYGPVAVLTALSRTVTSSVSKVYDEIENIDFKNLYYRKDICKPVD